MNSPFCFWASDQSSRESKIVENAESFLAGSCDRFLVLLLMVERCWRRLKLRTQLFRQDARQHLLGSFVKEIDLSLPRHFICICGDFLASLRSFEICDLLTGGLGVGTLSTPCAALRVHQDWINRRRVWFGVRSESERSCLVTGQVLFFSENIHLSMLSRSYVIPVETVTGSFIISREIGQRKNEGTSISSMEENRKGQSEMENPNKRMIK